jgi:hypothetical protein
MKKLFTAAVFVTAFSAMEREAISKNRVSPKNVRSRGNFLPKSLKTISVFLLCAVIISSCSPKLAVIKTKQRANDINISTTLKEFLKTHPQPSILLRVPYTPSNVTEANVKPNFIYGRIEKNLDKAGFPIRDRGLVEQVLKNGSTDYVEIGKVTKADLIIEIQNIEFSDNTTHTYQNKAGTMVYLKKTSEPINLCNNNNCTYYTQLSPRSASLDCKVTIVESGATVGYFTLYYTTCDEGCEFYVKRNIAWIPMLSLNKSFWTYHIYWGWTDTESFGEIIDGFSDIIINALKGN